jgi:hypothetical protein
MVLCAEFVRKGAYDDFPVLTCAYSDSPHSVATAGNIGRHCGRADAGRHGQYEDTAGHAAGRRAADARQGHSRGQQRQPKVTNLLVWNGVCCCSVLLFFVRRRRRSG